MSQTKIIKQELVREWRIKFPNIPTTKLSRIIYNSDNNHLVFRNSENIRTILRHIEGKTGDKNRKTMKDKSLFLEEARPMNPYKLPEPDPTPLMEYILKGERILVLSDIHFPHNDNLALTAAISYGKSKKVDCILLNGDILELATLSRFDKDIKARKVHEEIAMAVDFLTILHKEFNCPIIYKLGNHDAFLSRYLGNKLLEMPQLSDLHELRVITLENILKARVDFPLIFVDSKQGIIYHDLLIYHGHELSGMGSPVSPAKSAVDKLKVNCLISHHHTTSTYKVKDAYGRFIIGNSIGCLCNLKPSFMPINAHNLGWAYLEEKEGRAIVENIMFINGKIIK